MYKNVIRTTLLLCFMSINILVSQELPNIVPPSPEAAALANFTDVPVSHYTGLPSISVPIYTIQQKGVQIPISLSYHARGVQVSETAPRTGMGWSLQYGGSMSRQVRGKSDEGPGYSYLNNSQDFTSFSNNQNTRNSVHNSEVAGVEYDYYPDQFSFNAGGVSGKFVLDYIDGQPIIQSFGDITISYEIYPSTPTEPSGIGSFEVTDSNGIKYYFGKSKDGQRSARDHQNSSGKSVYTDRVVDDQSSSADTGFNSWKLMDIETTHGELISYYYEQNNGGFYRKSYDKHDATGNVTNSAGNMSNINTIHTRLSHIFSYETQLAKITFNQDRDSIVFDKTQTIREDYDGYALDKISIYSGSNLIKAFKFNYTYTTSTDQTNLLWYFQNTNTFGKFFKRMFLSSIEEKGNNGQKLPPYVFTYDPQILPSVFSSRQDYWGYYNGATNNGPFTRMFTYGNYHPDRRVNTLTSEAGILKEIKYPTGGKTKFTYEHNKGYIPITHGSLKIPSINPGSGDDLNLVLTKSDFTYDPNTGNYSLYTLQQLPNNTPVTYTFSCGNDFFDPNDPNPNSCLFNFTLNGGTVAKNQNIVVNTGSNSTSTIGITPISWNNDPDLHLEEQYNFQIIITYELPVDPLFYAAGKRINKIENISADGISTFKEYEYNFPYDEDLQTFGGPSGAIIGLPSYINQETHSLGFEYLTHYNDAGSPFGSFQANSIGYSGVIEYHGTKENNIGKTEYLFTNISDSGGDYYEFPYHPPTDNEWLRGKNVRTKFWKNNNDPNNPYTKVKEVYNKYLYGNNEYNEDLEFAGFLPPGFELNPSALYYDWGTNNNTSSDHVKDRTLFKLPLFMISSSTEAPNGITGYRIYHLTGGTQHLLRTEETDYYDDGNFEKKTVYSYNYPNHYQTASVLNKSSNEEAKIQTFTYPQDIPNTSTAIDSLIAQNRYIPLEVKGYQDKNNDGIPQSTEILSTVKTTYGWLNDVLEPILVQTGKGITNDGLNDRVEYLRYDNKSNPLEVSKVDGAHIAYIWGYNQQHPIAKIENATYSEVENAIGSLQSNYDTLEKIQARSNADDDRTIDIINSNGTINYQGKEGDLREALNALRNVLPNAMVSNYTYDPLIGVTSTTDPKGYTLYYDYDDFNRLKQIKDANGNLLSENHYNYKGQQQQQQ